MIDRLVPRSDRRHHPPLRYLGRALPLLLLAVLWPMTARAQDGVVTGLVVDAGIREPVPSALVELIASGGRVVRSTTTDNRGRFRIQGIGPGTYSLVISTVGYETRRIEGIQVGASPVVFDAIELTSRAFELNPVVVTASREREKALEAPAAVFTVPPVEIAEQPATTPADYVKGMPGVDVVSNGLSQFNVVARGFNNVFSGALFVLTDNRWASVPSLRFNAYNLIPQTNEDIERIEFVLGPASALYGPNVDRGVMHIITKSPLETQETVASVTVGERELFKGSFRHAALLSDDIGYKISGQFFRGRDWPFQDSVEVANRNAAIADGANPDTLLIGLRDFDQQRFSGTARLDFRLADRSTLALEGGATALGSSIEMTGIGSAQADDWTYWYVQGRLDHEDLFAQAYVNLSDAGDTYTLRAGDPIADNSLLYVGQVQHTSRVGDRQRFVYGADLIRTVPRTDGTITGKNEEDDNITEFGGYIQSETAVSPRLDLVAAARMDYHSVVDDVVFSPRAGAVFKPKEGQNFRVTYNRAFSQPTTNNLFLDIVASPRLGPFSEFAVRASGVPSETGFTFRRNCGPGSVLCMRSPFADGFLPYNQVSDALWQGAIDELEGIVASGAIPQLGTRLDPRLEATLRSLDPTGQSLATVLRKLDPTEGEFGAQSLSPGSVADVAPIEPTITNTFEVGYKGVIGDRVLVNLDVYYSRIEDFIGPLLVETPNAFLDARSVAEFIGPALADSGFTQLTPLVVGALAQAPLGTVVPEQAPDPDRPWNLFVTYRNFGKVELWGSDISATVLVTDEFSLSGGYSFVDDNFFQNLDGIADIALNAPQNKGSLRGQYRNDRAGLAVELQGRYVDSFPVNSGVFIGHIPSYVIFDANLNYELPWLRGTDLTASAYNLFDNKHREIVGAPELGRILLLRLRRTF